MSDNTERATERYDNTGLPHDRRGHDEQARDPAAVIPTPTVDQSTPAPGNLFPALSPAGEPPSSPAPPFELVLPADQPEVSS